MDEKLKDVLARPDFERVQQVLAANDRAIVVIGDAEGRMLWASKSGSQQVFGRDPSEFEGKSRLDFTHPIDRTRVREKLQMAAQGQTVQYHVRARTPDGRWQRLSTIAWCVEIGDDEQVIVSVSSPVGEPHEDPDFPAPRDD